MRYLHVDIFRCLPGLLRATGIAVYWCIDAPYGSTFVKSFFSHQVFKFRPVAFVLEPKPFVHRLQDGVSLLLPRCRIFAQQFSNACCKTVAFVIIGRGVGHIATIIIERIRCPDAAIGIIEMVTVGIPVTFLPFQMEFDVWPHLTEIGGIGIITEMPEQLVEEVEVHVVMVHHVVATWQTTEVAVRIHARAPFLLSPRQKILGIL